MFLFEFFFKYAVDGEMQVCEPSHVRKYPLNSSKVS